MDLSKCRYIVVEGPIGAGKTSLARELAGALHADPLFEQPEDNPFLARFYEDRARFALPTQLTFLFQRVASCARSRSSTCSGGRPSRTSCSTRTRCSRGSTCPTTSTRSTRRSTRT
jgi:hypothetical protein